MEAAMTPTPTRKDERTPLKRMLSRNAGITSIAAFFLCCVVAFSLSTHTFYLPSNLLNIVRQSAPLLIVATAMTLVITTAGIDLSIGSTLALVGALSAIALRAGIPDVVVILGGIGVGCAIGAINGYFIAFAGMPAFIVTLGTLSIVRGVALLLTQGYSIPIESNGLFTSLGRAWLLGIPLPAVIAIATLFAGWVALRHTRFGRYVIGIGTNAESVRRAGVPVHRVIMRVYILSGASAALAGMLITSRLGSGSSNQGVGFELDVIAAVVLGSTSLFGGIGTIVGTVLGALTIAVLGNGLILLHVSPFYTQIIQGTIMLLAIWMNTRIFAPQRRRKG